ncbi:MAG: hypothetical protein KOO69_06775 [Victivallales bacterium]|nr:hypothetical protein [Victivallales bacterium]
MKMIKGILLFIGLYPLCGLLGALIGLISDFGIRNIFQNIEKNPDIFINQFSSMFVIFSLIAPFSLIALFVVYRLNQKDNLQKKTYKV